MTREQIKDKLQTELNSIYCYNCRHDDGGAHCDYCHRKYISWQPSDQLLEWIMDVCGVEKDEVKKMEVELTNNVIEMSITVYDVEKVESRQYGSTEVFRFYFGKGKWSKEYRTPTYTYRVIER